LVTDLELDCRAMVSQMVPRISLALRDCRFCGGTGKRGGTCACVYRRVFRDCNARNHETRMREGDFARRPNTHMTRGGLSAGLEPAEFMVDFERTGLAALARCPVEQAVFWYHHLHRVEWRPCLPLIARETGQKMDRGNFFHAVYRVEVKVGRACMNLKPYSVWPPLYFRAA